MYKVVRFIDGKEITEWWGSKEQYESQLAIGNEIQKQLHRKAFYGRGIREQMENTKEYYSTLTVEKLKDVLTTLEKERPDTHGPVRFMSEFGKRIWDAQIAGDKKEIAKLNDELKQKQIEEWQALKLRIIALHGQDTFDKFFELRQKYKYRNSWNARYQFTIEKNLSYKEYDSEEYSVEKVIIFDINTGKFTTCITWSDRESGYDYGSEIIED